ncbi:hypothetical protein M422DRAFT_51516 [Sphaerobolus stellatus SS14]|uniref:Uncharacterized protein n=1 Tax=Sphaerobolus stellatus (strain SS14) TaxID=990650 RepID=A0A0C9VD23_SPHS4|nr:hypothetical protein M422DRAFT_51516 [Sphaerobolus stellatus SS14]
MAQSHTAQTHDKAIKGLSRLQTLNNQLQTAHTELTKLKQSGTGNVDTSDMQDPETLFDHRLLESPPMNPTQTVTTSSRNSITSSSQHLSPAYVQAQSQTASTGYHYPQIYPPGSLPIVLSNAQSQYKNTVTTVLPVSQQGYYTYLNTQTMPYQYPSHLQPPKNGAYPPLNTSYSYYPSSDPSEIGHTFYPPNTLYPPQSSQSNAYNPLNTPNTYNSSPSYSPSQSHKY